MTDILTLLNRGGPVLWLIAALSVLTLALILWKAWQLASLGAWSGGAVTSHAVGLWQGGDARAAREALAGRRSLRARLALVAMTARHDPDLPGDAAREEVARNGRRALDEARTGLRALELISTLAPLLGLLGTVVGMIDAFQALQAEGAQADPATLAGGIWQALLTTAAGMAVAIPAGAALVWFDSVIDRVQADMEDAATRIFLRGGGA